MRRGTTIISPTRVFTIFNNSTELIKASADPEKAPKLPARLVPMILKDFVKHYVRTTAAVSMLGADIELAECIHFLL